MLKTITPEEAARLLREDGAMLVDVREPDEHARERIPGARNLPISRLEEAELALQAGKTVLFHCRSGARTRGNAERLAAKAGPGCEADRAGLRQRQVLHAEARARRSWTGGFSPSMKISTKPSPTSYPATTGGPPP